ncbi:hypothetical protein N182_02170 [Sinorhizobium sp. GL2]|jgi:hypothetical protein|nr:hypothetical protein N182_02170 [Sinorhizobium sp. GL2]
MGSLMGNGQCRRALRPEKNLGDMSADVGLDQQGYAAMQYRLFLRQAKLLRFSSYFFAKLAEAC